MLNPQSLLLDFLKTVEKTGFNRDVVHLKLSGLKAENLTEGHVNSIETMFQYLIDEKKVQIFYMRNRDILLFFEPAQRDEVTALIVKVRFMFSKDPLLRGDEAAFSRHYSLKNEQQWRAFMAEVDRLLKIDAALPLVPPAPVPSVPAPSVPAAQTTPVPESVATVNAVAPTSAAPAEETPKTVSVPPPAPSLEERAAELKTRIPPLPDVSEKTALKGPGGVGEPGKKPPKPQAVFRPPTHRKATGKPLNPTLLAKIEDVLSGTDFSNMVRRQSICAIVGDSLPQPLFDELFVSIPDLRDTLVPDVDFSLTPWLLQHLTEAFDKGVLSNLSYHDDKTLRGDFSLNLNVSTILSPDFEKFDYNINSDRRSSIVLELQPADIFTDIPAYLRAHQIVKEKGYKLCIDLIPLDILPAIDLDLLGADLVKIVWTPDFEESIRRDIMIKNAIEKTGPSRIIMCRIDDEKGIEGGKKEGVSLFQGRYVQRLLSTDPRRRRVGTVLLKGK